MQTENPKLGQVDYNAAQEAFEALATFSTPDGDLRLPVQYPAALNLPEALVRHGLMARAKLARQEGSDLQSVQFADAEAMPAAPGNSAATPFDKARDFLGAVWNKAA